MLQILMAAVLGLGGFPANVFMTGQAFCVGPSSQIARDKLSTAHINHEGAHRLAIIPFRVDFVEHSRTNNSVIVMGFPIRLLLIYPIKMSSYHGRLTPPFVREQSVSVEILHRPLFAKPFNDFLSRVNQEQRVSIKSHTVGNSFANVSKSSAKTERWPVLIDFKPYRITFYIDPRPLSLFGNSSLTSHGLGRFGSFSDSVIGRLNSLLSFFPSTPNEQYTNTTKPKAENAYNPHHSRPQSHGLLAIQIIFVALLGASGIFYLARAFRSGTSDEAFGGYLIFGIAGVVCGAIGCFIVVNAMLNASYSY